MRRPDESLTPKERQVATLVWKGLTNREIAKLVGTTEQVVKNYLRTTFDKVGVWSRLELALYVANHGGHHWLDELPMPSAIGAGTLGVAEELRRAS
jgi:DNA-binding NarL/FixJ family response regulator